MPVNVTDGLLQSLPLPRLKGGSKEERGRIFIVGGAAEVPGAVLLAGHAAMRAGGGLLQIASHDDVAIPLAVSMPEAFVCGWSRAAELAGTSDAIVVGPGTFDGDETHDVTESVLRKSTCPVVIDAGALGTLGRNSRAVAGERPRAVITPHAAEMARLLETSPDEVSRDPVACARTAAARFGVAVVLKGETTHIAAEGEVYRFSGGCIGLAASGSGDVLAGIIGALLARGASLGRAALWGVALHARAGRALEERAGIGFLAREIPGPLPALLRAVPTE